MECTRAHSDQVLRLPVHDTVRSAERAVQSCAGISRPTDVAPPAQSSLGADLKYFVSVSSAGKSGRKFSVWLPSLRDVTPLGDTPLGDTPLEDTPLARTPAMPDGFRSAGEGPQGSGTPR